MSYPRYDDMGGRQQYHNRGNSYGMTGAPSRDPPPTYYYGPNFEDHGQYSKRSVLSKPKTWSRRVWIGVVVAAIIVLVAVIVGAVLGTRANRYPDYSKLNYSLVDTCE